MTEKINKNDVDVVEQMPIVGNSPEAKRLRRAVKKLAKIDSNVFIIGETGIGKELAARHIYQMSANYNRAFVKINCSALGKTIDMKDLYGEDAEGDQAVIRSIGLLEKSNNGILYLDNIGEMSPEYQEEFLIFLRDKMVRRVGSEVSKNVDMRVISTSEYDLLPDVESGKFRKELYYLMNSLTLVIPSLRERKQDIPELFSYFLKKFCEQEGREQPAVQSEIFESILEYKWKGNIRELENTVQNLIIMSPEDELSPDFLPFRIKKHPFDFLEPRNLKRIVSDVEIYLIKKALGKFGGNQVKAAKLLGVPVATLRFKMKKYSILRS